MKYKWGKHDNGKWKIKTENGIKLNNSFDLHSMFLETINYGSENFKEEISTKLITGNRKNQEGSTELERRGQITGCFRSN